MRLIDADDTLKVFLKIMNLPKDYCGPSDIKISIDAVFSVLGQVPDADPVPVKHGYWFGVHECPQCSECLEYVTEDGMWDEDYALYKYCPHCGARMDGNQNGN